MDKFTKFQMNRKQAINHLHEKMRDLYEEERLALLSQGIFTSEMDTPLRTLKLGLKELNFLESHGIWVLGDVLVLGWHGRKFVCQRARKNLSAIEGIGLETINILMEKICSVLTSDEKRQLVAELAKEIDYSEWGRDHYYRWARMAGLQYEEVKQILKQESSKYLDSILRDRQSKLLRF
jgi:hypothetical protein